MSKATKRKHVTKEVLDEFVLPTANQKIVKVKIENILKLYTYIVYIFPIQILIPYYRS